MSPVTPARASLREPLIAFAATTLLAAGFGALGAAVPLVRDNLSLLIAIVFFLAPLAVAMRAGREPEFDYREVGLRADPVGLNLRVLGVMVLLSFPAFVIGFFLFYGRTCAGAIEALSPLVRADVRTMARLCARPPAPARQVRSSRGVVPDRHGHPRGGVFPRLSDGATGAGLAARRASLFGAKVGWALVVSSALFAVSHVAVIPNPQRLAVFFPALLFGWMRARTGSIAAGAVFHALCNLLSDVLHTSYFWR